MCIRDRSTGEAVERLTSQGERLTQNHLAREAQGESLTPLQRAQQTAKEVAQSTGEAVERLGSELKKVEQNHLTGAEMKLHSTSRYRDTTPKRQVAPDTHKLEPVDQNSSSISPLQRAELTAQRVAKSTGKALEKLATSEHSGLEPKPTTHSVPLHKQNGYLHDSETTTKENDIELKHKHTPPTNIHSAELDSTNTESESDLSDSEYSTTSETRLTTPAHCNPAGLEYPESDGLSSLEKVKRTAEVVADSTGVAVQKLSTSLSESF